MFGYGFNSTIASGKRSNRDTAGREPGEQMTTEETTPAGEECLSLHGPSA